MAQANCRRCGRPIDFVKNKAGKFFPVNPKIYYFEPDEHGNELIVNYYGELIRANIIDKSDVYDPLRVGHKQHWGECNAFIRRNNEYGGKTKTANEIIIEKEQRRIEECWDLNRRKKNRKY